MKMSIAKKTKELVQMVGPKIQKHDCFRTPMLARMKLELTL
jgi:hypothetical protein